VLLGTGLTMLLCLILGGGYLSVSLLRPELVRPDLRREFSLYQLTLGESTESQVRDHLGEPDRERRESLSILYEYASLDLSLRLGLDSGVLEWYEIRSDQFATARGVRVGDRFTAITEAYGKPTEVTPLPDSSRVRYIFGMVYVLEFWLDNLQRVERIAFYRT
jgi:hypothetical protein